MTTVVISGIRGRMGATVAVLAAERADVRVVAGIGRVAAGGAEAARYGCERIVALADAADVVRAADVVIDFSTPVAVAELLERTAPALAGRALVTGTTGLAADTQRRLDELARSAAVLSAANFSAGVNLLLALVEQVAGALPAEGYDIEIVDAHHGGKIDAPSGTALALGEAAARGRGQPLHELRRDGRSGETGTRPRGEVGFHAIRGGGVIGEHSVLLLGARERLELRHVAMDRSLFADGALRAALWLAGRAPGRYGMRDVLGL